MGCHMDSSENRNLPHFKYMGKDNSVEKCVDYCTSQGTNLLYVLEHYQIFAELIGVFQQKKN